MVINILLLIFGFVLLIKGADFFVDGASSTAQNFKVSKMLIGLTIIAFGTSSPEFAVSMQALASGSTDMLLGNVIGSNVQMKSNTYKNGTCPTISIGVNATNHTLEVHGSNYVPEVGLSGESILF